MIGVILAAPDVLSEPDLVAAAGAAGLHITRRCVDAADLMACAAADVTTPIVVSAGVPRLSGALVSRLQAAHRPVIALAVIDEDQVRVRAWGITAVVPVGEAASTMQAVAGHLSGLASGPQTGVWDTGLWASPDATGGGPAQLSEPAVAIGAEGDRAGRVISVWGPPGAPGRSTTAIGLAEAYAQQGHRTLLVDADTHAPSIALMIGMLEDTSGLVVACRHADNGSLTPRSLRSTSREVAPNMCVLGGLLRPDRWPDARPGALSEVWRCCRRAFDVTVIDVGASIEDEPTGSANPVLASQRNAAAVTALAQSDAVLAVCRADSLGLARLAIGLPVLADAAATAARVVCVVGAERGQPSWAEITSAVRGAGITDEVVRLEGRRQADRMLRLGLLPSEIRGARRERRSRLRLAAAVLAAATAADEHLRMPVSV